LIGFPRLHRIVRKLKHSANIEALRTVVGRFRREYRPAAIPQDLPLNDQSVLAIAHGLSDSAGRFLRWAAPGHFYSPVPDYADIEQRASRIFDRPDQLEGVNLNIGEQLRMLRKLSAIAQGVTFPNEKRAETRFSLDNPSFCEGDALILHAMLRYLRPRRYLEVGSGWTTALALDVTDQWLEGSMRVSCIEPYPYALRQIIRPLDQIDLIETPVQQAPLELFSQLEERDVLFIDCSHVVKTGSDAHYLITRVLPVISPGVYIHIHDIFWPFEYPHAWVEEGRAWSEAYLVHAFLLFNEAFEIVLFNDWLGVRHPDRLAAELPAMAESPGGSLWLRRNAKKTT
jgi:hypothetical protein